MRVLVFGDSITQGYWDTEGGWVDRLRKSFDESQIQDLQNRDEPTIFNLGISADNTKNILKRIEAETLARTRNNNLPVVILQIGVNDSSVTRGNAQVSIEEYKNNLIVIIKKMEPLCSRLIFVGLSGCDETKTTPVTWGDHYYTNDSIKNYENAMQATAQAHDVHFIPLFDTFMRVVKTGADLLPDGLHPNNHGHQLILEIIYKDVKKLLT